MSNLTLNTKVYNGRGIVAGISNWLNTASGVLASFSRVTASVFVPNASSGSKAKAVVKWNLRIPLVAEEASACACPGTVIDELDCYIQVRMSQGVSESVRTDAALQVKDLVASSEFQASIISLTQPTA